MNGAVVTLPRSDVNYIWDHHRKQRLTPFIMARYVEKLRVQLVDIKEIEHRATQVINVIYQITAFGYVKGRFHRCAYTVGVDLKGGAKYGAKTIPYYGDEMQYGSDGALPNYWISPYGDETIGDYLRRLKEN